MVVHSEVTMEADVLLQTMISNLTLGMSAMFRTVTRR